MRRCIKQGSSRELCQLNFDLGYSFANCVNSFLQTRSLPSIEIDAIGSHGQTVAHRAPEQERHGSTLQIASISVIAELTGITTLGHFRERDMVRGGQGAPLVPLLDWYLCKDQVAFPVALHNLGSISNLSVLSDRIEDTVAFDTGPANQMIDYFASLIEGEHDGIDRDGTLSAQGVVDQALLLSWMKHPFLAEKPPKSASFDDFSPEFMTKLSSQQSSKLGPLDLLRTAVEFCAQSIAEAYRKHVLAAFPTLKRVYFSGGGVHNQTLMQSIAKALPELEVLTLAEHDKRLTDCKEALAFALLADASLSAELTTICKSTGASQSVVSGEIAIATPCDRS
ncbi:MAG: anhydro-N-acetylmuramic acid kinase [Myxococcales bacterium]|nr:MAG: anhydro-N-acetylmuramic acid kinase [Myxococcales bacterium]